MWTRRPRLHPHRPCFSRGDTASTESGTHRQDNTPETFDNDEGLTFSVTATSDGTTIKTVKLSYKDAKMQNYETYNLTRDGSVMTSS